MSLIFISTLIRNNIKIIVRSYYRSFENNVKIFGLNLALKFRQIIDDIASVDISPLMIFEPSDTAIKDTIALVHSTQAEKHPLYTEVCSAIDFRMQELGEVLPVLPSLKS